MSHFAIGKSRGPSTLISRVPHTKCFTRLNVEEVSYNKGRQCIRILRQCDAINGLVLVIENPDRRSINELISSIILTIGGQIIDEFHGFGDIETLIASVASFYGKRIRHIDGQTFVPLCLAPCHEPFNMLPISSMVHDVLLSFSMFDEFEYHICGNCYFLEKDKHDTLIKMEFVQMIYQCSCISYGPCKSGSNTFTYLHFLHPLRCIFIWGPPKQNIRRVKMTIDGMIYMDSSVAELEYQTSSRYVYRPENVIVIDLSDSIECKADEGLLDCFSYKANARTSALALTVVCDEIPKDCEDMLKICGINTQESMQMRGMFGLTFSK